MKLPIRVFPKSNQVLSIYSNLGIKYPVQHHLLVKFSRLMKNLISFCDAPSLNKFIASQKGSTVIWSAVCPTKSAKKPGGSRYQMFLQVLNLMQDIIFQIFSFVLSASIF